MKIVIIIFLVTMVLSARAQHGAGKKLDSLTYYVIDGPDIVWPIDSINRRSKYLGLDDNRVIIKNRNELAVLPVSDIRDIVSLCPKVYQCQRGKDINIAGGRTDETLYIIDGVQIMR